MHALDSAGKRHRESNYQKQTVTMSTMLIKMMWTILWSSAMVTARVVSRNAADCMQEKFYLPCTPKEKNPIFDEKGVFGSVCHHDCPLSFHSIKYGERISYSV